METFKELRSMLILGTSGSSIHDESVEQEMRLRVKKFFVISGCMFLVSDGPLMAFLTAGLRFAFINIVRFNLESSKRNFTSFILDKKHSKQMSVCPLHFLYLKITFYCKGTGSFCSTT